jgi:predicted MFS family arabinose efflux permease
MEVAILKSMSRESAQFFSIAIPVGCVGTVIGLALGWSDTAVFVSGMGPLALVMLIFMLREPKAGAGSDHGVKPPTHRRA